MDREKKAEVVIPISDKIDFKIRAIKRDPEGHFIILKGRIHKEDINIVNIYAPNIGAPKYRNHRESQARRTQRDPLQDTS